MLSLLHTCAYFYRGIDRDPIIFGRVLTLYAVRNNGYGKWLIQAMLDYCENYFKSHDIYCTAQLYLKSFYESFGFKTVGDIYDDAGIAHVKMIKSTDQGWFAFFNASIEKPRTKT